MQPCAPARCSDDGRGSSGRAGQGQLFSPCVYRTLYRTHMHPHTHTHTVVTCTHTPAHTCTRTHTSMFDSLMRVLRGRTRTRAIGPVTGTCITAVLVCPHCVCARVCVHGGVLSKSVPCPDTPRPLPGSALAGASECTPCSTTAGNYCPSGSTSSEGVPCPAGTYSSAAGASRCACRSAPLSYRPR